MRKGWIFVFAAAATLSAQADPMRTLNTRENRLPELYQLEAGVSVESMQVSTLIGQDELTSVVPQFRYGLAPELTLNVALPYVARSPEVGDSVDGFGDAKIGLTLRA